MDGLVRHIALGIYGNTNQTLHQYRRENYGVQTPASKHCRLLEEFLKRQNLELAQKQRVHEEMRALIDWLKRDLSMAEARVRELEEEKANDREDEEKEADSIAEKNEKRCRINRETEIAEEKEESSEKKKLESLLVKLNDKNEKIETLQEKLDNDEREIEDLQKENEGYYEQIRKLQTTIRRQERVIEIDREVEKEREERLKYLAEENEDLRSRLSLLQHSL